MKQTPVLGAISLALIPAAVQAQAPPAGYNTVQTGWVSGTTDPGGWAGGSGHTPCVEVSANTTLPWDTAVIDPNTGYPSLRVNVTGHVSWWQGLITPRGWGSATIGQYYNNGNLEFDVKGNVGGEVFKIGLQDVVYERSIGGVVTKDYSVNHTSTEYFTVTTGWTHVSVPLKTFIPAGSPLNLNQIQDVIVQNANGNDLKFWISSIKLTTTDKEPSYPPIDVNQVGYTTAAPKYALVADFYENLTSVVNGTAFSVKRSSDNVAVYNGTLSLITDYDPLVSGDKILKADFSTYNTPGTYYISVAGLPNSSPFTIGDTVLDTITRNGLKYFYWQRANLALVEPFSEGWAHPLWQTDLSDLLRSQTGGTGKDVHAGWFDAGDQGKYTSAAATAVSDLMWAYDSFPSKFPDSQTNIPESGNGKSDLLDEIKVETDFMLRMQDAATGGFWSRVGQGVTDETSARLIDDIATDPVTGLQVTQVKPTSQSADAVAALAHASITFASYDPTYAATCLAAAKSGWTYLVNHPSLVPSPSGPYHDDSDGNDRLWAAAELSRATNNDPTYNTYFVNNYASYVSTLTSSTAAPHGVGGMEQIAFISYMKSANRDPGFVTWFTTNWPTYVNTLSAHATAPWGNTQSDTGYWWGSNMPILEANMDLYLGANALGNYSSTIRNIARQNINYVLGINPLSMNYVHGYGANSSQNTFSSIYQNDNKPGEPTGYMPGGANEFEGAWFSRFHAKCFSDSNAEWTTNEHTVYWNSALVFSAAYLSSEATLP